MSEQTARRWMGRNLASREAALIDASSRPKFSSGRVSEPTVLAFVELRRRRLTHSRISASLGVSEATFSRVLRRIDLSKLSRLQPVEPVQRYEHAALGDLLRIDTKKLGQIERLGHRITGNPCNKVRGIGWEMLFVAIDDHAGIGGMPPMARLKPASGKNVFTLHI